MTDNKSTHSRIKEVGSQGNEQNMFSIYGLLKRKLPRPTPNTVQSSRWRNKIDIPIFLFRLLQSTL